MLRRRLTRERVGHFATSDGQRPAVVPVCFVLLGNTFYHAIDAKPKEVPPARLRRVRNVRANGLAALLIDHYEEDWRRLWFVLAIGDARLIESGEEQQRAIRALRRKYRQYREVLPLAGGAPVIALDVGRLRHWQPSSGGPVRSARPGRRA